MILKTLNFTMFSLVILFSFPDSKSYALLNEPQLTNDITKVLLYKTINESVQNYYNKYLSAEVMIPPYSMEVLDIKVPDENNPYMYQETILLDPYVGPHIGVGQDIITITFDLNEIRVNDFKHIKDEALPPHWKHILK